MHRCHFLDRLSISFPCFEAVLIASRFYTDIRRWRLVVPPHEGALFDEILNSLWDINTSSSQPPLPPDDALLYFQRLVTNLISKDDVSHLLELTFDSGGRKLDEIRDEYAPTDNLDIFFAENTLLLPSKYAQQNEHHERDPPILKHWKPASPKVVYLMATAVFTTFIIFMLGEFATPNLISSHISKRSFLLIYNL